MDNQQICDQATSCTNETMSVVSTNDSRMSLYHNVNISQSASIFNTQYDLMSFERQFSITCNSQGDSGITAIVRYDDLEIPCISNATNSIGGNLSENCVQSFIIPMYLNLADRVFVYRKVVETISFSVAAHPKQALFREKWGTGAFWKFVIRKTSDTEHLQIQEEFHIVQDGIDTLLHTAEVDRNPFPMSVPTSWWGLYGQTYSAKNVETPDPTVRQIILFPLVPSLAMPQDLCGQECAPSINNYGFYDYNEMDGGMIPSSLGEEDGGKDFYYPYWIRQMTANPIMRQWADTRWAKRGNHLNPQGGEWIPPEPTTYGWPFGSFVKDTAGNYIHSAIFTDINNESFLYNKCSPLDIFEKITTVSGIDNTLYCPITLISNVSGLNESTGNTIDNDEITDDTGEIMTDDFGVDIYV